jgi:dTDP-4-amino-4,6-dideoxygalactose transaminase
MLHDARSLPYDHWYDVVHAILSRQAGYVSWWVDGRRIFGGRLATLFTRPDGSVSSVELEVGHYRSTEPSVRYAAGPRRRKTVKGRSGYNESISRSASSHMRVPFVDLEPASRAVKRRVLDRIEQTIDRGDFTNGEQVGEFERAFADYCGLAHCVGVASGLDALRLSLVASGIDEGAGVIVPASTFAATFEAVLQAGGSPVVVDVAAADYALDLAQVERAAAGRDCTHLLPVHLYGQLADMRGLSRIADTHGLQIIEDACQAHGARRDGLRAGHASRAAAFSFYPAKNLGAMGDAGALVTDDAELAVRTRALRVHGETRKYHHEHIGFTARLDTIQAIVLLEKLPLLEDWNRQRRDAARFYEQSLAELDDLERPTVPAGSEPAWHLYVVRVPDPGRLAAFLAERGIQTARHYPEPPHLAPAYRSLGLSPGAFPVAEALARECLSLPLFPGIEEAQLEWVCDGVREYFRRVPERAVAVSAG